MRTLVLSAIAAGLVFAGLASAAPPKKDLTPEEAADVIRKFSEKELAFSKARELYTYRQSAKLNVLDNTGTPREKWEMTSDIIFSPEGRRTERVVYAPMSTLQSLIMTPQDEQDLRSIQPFVLTSNDIDQYHVRFLGWEQLDEIGCYVFAVKPKKIELKKRAFTGLIYVDDRDLQIVKSYGRAVGLEDFQGKNKAPKFETFREQIDGKFWFPVYTVANDILNFETGSVPIRMVVTYKDYKQFKSESTITFGDVAEPPKEPKKP